MFLSYCAEKRYRSEAFWILKHELFGGVLQLTHFDHLAWIAI
jgi:hypothetical protein